MKIIQHFVKLTISAAFLFAFAVVNFAQTNAAPQEEKLLNGLKLLTFKQKSADKITVKLRIHSGSSFDPKDKEGVMALFADVLFPNQDQVKGFFTDELGGSFEIVSNYDYIQITATGTNDKLLPMLETIAQAITQTQIDKETTPKVKTARLAKIREWETDPSYVANLAVRKQLLGTFPYGRAQSGTADSIAKVDFADLLLAKDRFLLADNATLTVSGDFKQDLVYRAARRYFGNWRKSEKIAPSTFAMAEQPKEMFATISSPTENSTELRYAMRGLARKDKDFYASKILSDVYFNRLKEKVPPANRDSVSIEYDEHILPGIIIYGVSGLNAEASKNLMMEILSQPVSTEEFSRSKTFVAGKYVIGNQADLWLDSDTYKLGTPGEEAKKTNAVTLADVNRIAEQMKTQPFVSTLVGK